jgi:cyclopropane fatty-acyl-phospholipid synthase-like methyltransferase
MQFTAIPEDRYDEYRRSSDFIKEYVFPGGCLPCFARVTSAMSTASRLWYIFSFIDHHILLMHPIIYTSTRN